MRQIRWIGLVFATSLVLALAACSSKNPGSESAGADPATELPLSTNLPVATSTLTAGGAGSSDVNAFGLPNDLTGHELIASRAGTSVYSGYACFIDLASLDRCGCDSAVFQRVTFTFLDGGLMDYHFEGEDYATTWQFVRQGPDQWYYKQDYVLEGTDTAISRSILLTFNETGYTWNEGAALNDGSSVVACPDVTFRRIALPGTQEATSEPPPTATPTPY
jgi:hypothetical protein